MSILDNVLAFAGRLDPRAAALIALYRAAEPYISTGISIAQGIEADKPLADAISAEVPQLVAIAGKIAEHFHGAATAPEHVEAALAAMVAPDRWTPEAEKAWQDRAVGSS